MRLFRSFAEAPEGERFSVVVGNFDGIHAGHRVIFEEARRHSGTPAVISFDPHPRSLLQPGYAPRMLTTFDERRRLLDHLGIGTLFLLSFEPLRGLSAVAFLDLLHRSLPLSAITVGFNFNFGRNQEGNPDILLWWSKGTAVSVRIVPPVMRGAMRISSSAIREFILNGEVDRAAEQLAYPYLVSGTVRHGRRVGARIGRPTVNLATPEKLLPPDGVYATVLVAGGRRYRAVTNIGTNPTIDAEATERTIETHVPGETLPDLYDTLVAVYFLKRIRREIHFSSPEKLREKIAEDIAVAREVPLPASFDTLPDMADLASP